MNNIKKIGLTALAGSLVTLGSAQAGDISVSGSINATMKFGKGGENTTRSIGTDRDVTFSGGGELDNGTTFSVSTLLTDAMAVSSSATVINTPSFGSFTMGASTGSASYKYDEEVPQAYEQLSDGHQNTANLVGNFMDNNHILYTSPTFEFAGAGITLDLGYSPQATDEQVSDGGQATYSETYGKGTEAGVTITYEGLKLGAYGAERENTKPDMAGSDYDRDEFNGAWYAKYSMGPVSIGYSETYLDAGLSGAIVTVNTPKTVRTSNGIFEGQQMSIAFNVNENMSISYTTGDDTFNSQDDAATATTSDDDVTKKTDAIQLAYSMGVMSIKAYNMEVTNPKYDDDAPDQSVTEIALVLSF
jgi:outer membrane protein OmpU